MTTDGWFPLCFDSHRQYSLWCGASLRAARKLVESTNGAYRFAYCEDCTEEYRAKMQAAGRCHPHYRNATKENHDATTDR